MVDQTPANVDVPSSCPHVVGCGGTYKTPTEETVWNDNPGQTDGEGTGGGYSTIFPVQAFQIGAPAPPAGSTAGKGRMVPDVAADADPNTGYDMVVHGAQTVVGGTSAVAPLYAGLFASFGTKLGFVTPKLWQNQNAFNDITIGGNGLYNAAPGPDPCSGIGSPVGTSIAALFVTKSARTGIPRCSRNHGHDRFHGVQRESQALPLVETAAQRPHALDAQFVQGHRRFRGGGFAGAGAIEHDVAVAGNLVDARG